MYTTIIHPLRKAYCLSINEYCVIEAVRGLANNTKYEGWCLMSAARIATALDLSDDTIRRAYARLEAVGLIERRKKTPQDTAIRSVDEWNEWFMSDKADLLLSLKTGNAEITTIQQKKKMYSLRNLRRGYPQFAEGVSAICGDYNTNSNTNNNTSTSKATKKFLKMSAKQKKIWHEHIANYENVTGREASVSLKIKKRDRILSGHA